MDKIWFKNYGPDIPHAIDPSIYSSLVDMLEESIKKNEGKPAFTNLGVKLTFKQVDKLSQAFAGFLQHRCQLKKGDRVVVMLPNLLQYPVVMFGALRAGMIVVNMNPLYTAREINVILKDSGAKCIVLLSNFAHVVEQALENTEIKNIVVTEIGDLLGPIKGRIVNFIVNYVKKIVPQYNLPQAIDFQKTLGFFHRRAFKKVAIESGDIAYLQYTGGTTGMAKGAMLTHRNMIANVLQAFAWIESFFKEKIEGGVVTALPLYHIFSLTANCLVFFRMGLLNILITNPRDIPGFVKELKRQNFSVITGVNTLFNGLLHDEEFTHLDFSELKFSLGGGMAVQRAVAEKWKEVTGVTLLEAYGLTETSPAVTINPLTLKRFNGSVGLPLPSTDVKICDEKGNELLIGQPGELYVYGPQVMKGYWNKPEDTRQVLNEEGWLKTGDIATIDSEGFVRLVDRKKDIIIVSGFNVYPNEVEDMIASIPGVREVAVIGVKSEEHGEIVKAFIVKNLPTLTEEDIVNQLHGKLTNYKIPREIEFRDNLPKTNVGKISRFELRNEEMLHHK